MNIKAECNFFHGNILALPSKSESIRAIILAAFSHDRTKIYLSDLSGDMVTVMGCLKALGADFEYDGVLLTVKPISKISEAPRLNCQECGAALRFLLPLTKVFCEKAEFSGIGRLPQRPIEMLILEMERMGCNFSCHSLPFFVAGRLKSGKYFLRGDVSSQFVTGLLMALPLLEGDSEIVLTSPLESFGYVDMTMELLSKFSVSAVKTAEGFKIEGGQKLKPLGEIRINGDFSNAAFWLSGAALNGDVTVRGLSLTNCGDGAIVKILENFGAWVRSDGDSVRIKSGKLVGIEIDGKNIPDLVPILAVVALGASGKTTIKNVGRLRFKESDRLLAIEKNLKAIGGDIRISKDTIIINGGKRLRGGTVSGFSDHRIIMSMAIAAAICDGDIVIEGGEYVKKSYPAFFSDYERMGGSVTCPEALEKY